MNANVITTLNGLFKEVYADNLEVLVPKAARLQKDAPFVSRDKQEGNQYHQPVRLTRAHGWTLSDSGDAFPLNPPEPARSKDATIQGSSFVLREVISYAAAAKLSSGKGKDQKRAFVSGSAYMVENMTETAAFVKELQLAYGQSDVGIKESRSNDSNTQQTFVFTKATFIAAMWSGLENGWVDWWTSDGVTQLNSGEVKVINVNTDTRAVTFEGLEADLDAVNSATSPKVYLRGTKAAGMLGLRSIIANAGLMFGINASDYSLWAGNTYSAASGSLSFAKIMRGMNKPVNRGLMTDMNGYINPKSWTDCQNDLAALRRFADKAGGKLEQGADALMYHSQNGSVTLVPHIFLKPSEAMFVPKGKMIRVGASDTTFSPPGVDADSFWENLPDHAGIGTRCYWNEALFLPCPAQCLLINNIVNSDD